jgi:hypothetical protein
MGPVLILFLITAIVWFALEFYLVGKGKGSISGRIWQANKDWPALGWLTGLVVGVLMGHFFFGQCGPY